MQERSKEVNNFIKKGTKLTMTVISRIKMKVTWMMEMTNETLRMKSMTKMKWKRVRKRVTKALHHNHMLKDLTRDNLAISETV